MPLEPVQEKFSFSVSSQEAHHRIVFPHLNLFFHAWTHRGNKAQIVFGIHFKWAKLINESTQVMEQMGREEWSCK